MRAARLYRKVMRSVHHAGVITPFIAGAPSGTGAGLLVVSHENNVPAGRRFGRYPYTTVYGALFSA